ncbi:hypothetical protein NL676_021318 [Syzygium grande]|nr:hypothetical protein NL676_021318 [Syzygium grande]
MPLFNAHLGSILLISQRSKIGFLPPPARPLHSTATNRSSDETRNGGGGGGGGGGFPSPKGLRSPAQGLSSGFTSVIFFEPK